MAAPPGQFTALQTFNALKEVISYKMLNMKWNDRDEIGKQNAEANVICLSPLHSYLPIMDVHEIHEYLL